jgi:hypothetical protein
MKLTSEQKKARKHARIWTKNVVYAIQHATDGRKEWKDWTAENWAVMAQNWAKFSANCAFQAHPELREV